MLEGEREIARRPDPELQALTGTGVDEAEQRRMERRASDAERIARWIAVHLVPEYRVAQVREVDPYLVGAPGAELRLHERHRAQLLDRPHGRLGRAPALAGRERRSTGAGPRAADAAGHENLARQLPADEREVAAFHGVGAELALEVLGRGM